MSQDLDPAFPLSQGTWDHITAFAADGRILSQSETVDLIEDGCYGEGYVSLEAEPFPVSQYAPQQFESMWPIVNDNNLLPQVDEDLANNDNAATIAPIPTSTRWPGPYGFDVSFGPQKAIPKKGKGWIYSESLDKLFVNIDTQCKFRFKMETYPVTMETPMVRAMPIFTKDEHLQEVVKRCHHHRNLDQKKGVVAADHFVRCENQLACYEADAQTKRQSVTVPFDRPQAGNNYTEELYKFMCLNSCLSLARRPMQIIFTLEVNGEVVGRCPLDIRVCACPGRDIKSEEKTLKKRAGLVRTNSSEASYLAPALKRRRTGGEESRIYTIQVDSLAKYEFMMKMRDALDRYGVPNQQDSAAGSQSTRVSAALGRTLSNTSTSSLTRPSTSSSQRTREVTVVKQEKETIKDWLGSFGMSAYTDQFAAHGFVLLEQMESVTKDELANLRIGLQHSDNIWKEVIKLRQSCGGQVSNSQPRTTEVSRVKFSRVVSLKKDTSFNE